MAGSPVRLKRIGKARTQVLFIWVHGFKSLRWTRGGRSSEDIDAERNLREFFRSTWSELAELLCSPLRSKTRLRTFVYELNCRISLALLEIVFRGKRRPPPTRIVWFALRANEKACPSISKTIAPRPSNIFSASLKIASVSESVPLFSLNQLARGTPTRRPLIPFFSSARKSGTGTFADAGSFGS